MNEIINPVPLAEEVLDVGPSWEDAKECLERISVVLAIFVGAAALSEVKGVSRDLAALAGIGLELLIGLPYALSGPSSSSE